MLKTPNTINNCTPKQLKLPIEIERIIEISDPVYNMQIAVCDEYIATLDVKQYVADIDCFIPLMGKFNKQYGKYPKYPVEDAGYGSFNNYIYCEQHGMEKFMKFTMFEKRN